MKLRLLTGWMAADGFRCLAAIPFVVVAMTARGDVVVDLVDGTSASGRMARLTDASLDLVVGGSSRSVGLREIRTIEWRPDSGAGEGDDAAATARSTRRRPVRIGLVDGSVLEGDELLASDKTASVVRDGRSLPIARDSIATAEFRGSAADQEERPPSWLAGLEEGVNERAVESDVVVVGSAEKPEFVECAIIAVAPDAVSVLLDDETIRVKRSKVIGLKWLRNKDVGQAPGPPPAAVVEIDGGRLLARKVALDGEELSIWLDDGEPVRVPLAEMRRIDFASGRTVSLVSRKPERVVVEPWFGLFTTLDGIAGHFEPRQVVVACEGAGSGPRKGLRLRPRTTVEWQMPENARNVVMTLAESSALVTISVDGREAYRGQPSTPVPLVVDAAGGRRLSITVDFPPSGPGTGGPAAPGVVLVEPRIER